MTQVTLGYSYDDHQPGETIDVEPNVANRLVADGIARFSPEPYNDPGYQAAEDQEDEREPR